MTVNINRLSLGNIGFSSIKKEDMIYVDKTKLIYDIASQKTPIFFSRPRRFGKSLLINTLHELFENGLKNFRGLDIEKIWKDKTYKVVHLDFSDMAEYSAQDLKRDLGDVLIQQFSVRGLVSQIDEIGIRNPNRILDEICRNLEDNSIVLLIDEYDAPLTHHINQRDELNEIIKVLNNFYATVKQYTNKFRLIFITGITRASHISIFSSFNNLVDLSLKGEFNSLLGFSKNDIKKYFQDYIENAAYILKTNINNIYDRLEEYYDGFQFSLNADETVYNPWSILCFFKYPEDGFKNYWFDSGGTSTIIMNYLKIKNDFDFIEYKEREFITNQYTLESKYEITNIPYNILLLQAGYYTIKKIDDGIALLKTANKEVEECLYRLYLIANNLEPKNELMQKMIELKGAIDNKELEKIISIFNAILNECVSSMSKVFNDERSVRDILYAALTNIPALRMIKEHDTAEGQSDLEIFTKKTCMVIEFKRTYINNRTPKVALALAKKQIEEKRYGIAFSKNYTLYRVAMVISTEDKMIIPDFCQEVL